MLFDGLLIFVLPFTFGHDDVGGSFLLEDFSLLFSSDDVEERDVKGLASLVEHSSQSRGSSSVNDSFFALGVLVDVGHTDNSKWVNNA